MAGQGVEGAAAIGKKSVDVISLRSGLVVEVCREIIWHLRVSSEQRMLRALLKVVCMLDNLGKL